MADMEVVFKKACSYAQPQNLVYVKQLLVVRENDKNYLVLRLVNERAEKVSAVTISVVQYDEYGREIGIKSETLDVTDGVTDKPFVPERKILLSDSVADCKVLVTSADYGVYRYRSDGKSVAVDYNVQKPPAVKPAVSASKKTKAGKDGVVVSGRTLKAPLLVIIGMFVALALALVAVYVHTLYFVEHEKTFLYSGVEYAFENDDKSDGSNIYVVGYNGARSRIVIPQYIEGHEVTHIAEGAFRNNDSLTSIGFEADIPVEDYAFAGCSALRTVEFEKITELGIGAFENCVKLQEVVLTDKISVVPRDAFCGCTSLETISVSQSDKLIKIGQNAFGGCTGLRSVDFARRIDYTYNAGNRGYFTGSAIRKLHLVDFDTDGDAQGNNRRISALFGFDSANEISDISLGELVIDRLSGIPATFCANLSITKFEVKSIDDTTVGARAFYGCSNLEEFILPVGMTVTGVCERGFAGTALTGFNGISVEVLEDGAFEDCAALTSASFSGNVVLSEMGEGVFSGCASLRSASLPIGITFIPRATFMNCAELTEVRYTNASVINAVDDNAFYGCASLESVSFPGGVLAALGSSSFEGCSALRDIELTDALLTVGDNAFKDCAALETFTVPDSVVYMGRGAFTGCIALESLTLPFVGEQAETNNYLAFLFGANNSYYTENTYVPEALASVTVTCAESIGARAFLGCTHITEINLPDVLMSVGERAFYGCTALASLTLPNSVIYIGDSSFGGCTGLTELSVPFVGDSRDSVYPFFSYLFGSYSADDSSSVPESLVSVAVTDTTYIESQAFYNCEHIEEISLPDTLWGVGSYAFAGCSSITSLVIPDSVVTLGEGAFAGMEKLADLSTPFVGGARSSVTDFAVGGDGYTLGYLFESETAPRSLKKLAITDSEYIASRALYNCLFIEQVVLDCNVLAVASDAFERCFKLFEVFNYSGLPIEKGSVMYGGVAQYALKVHTDRDEAALPQTEADGFRYVRDDLRNWYLIDCDTSVEEATLPASVQSDEYSFTEYALWQYIFYNCTQLVSVDIPANITAVGNGAFYGCTALTSAHYANDSLVTAIGDDTFNGCYMLYDIVLPAGLRSYGARAFYNCSRIKTVIVPRNTVEGDIGADAFAGCVRLFEVLNLSNLDITAGSSEYGQIAYNARRVTRSDTPALESAIVDGVHYIALNDNGIRFWAVDYYGEDGDLELSPFTYSGATVNRIGIYYCAFTGYGFIKNLTVSTAVSAINNEFYGCENIESVSFTDGGANSYISLGSEAFMSARNSLTSVASDVSLTFTGQNVFPTDKLTDAVFGARINTLSNYTFAPAVYEDAPARLNAEFADIGTIENGAFGGTHSLYSLTVSGRIDYIDNFAFNGCDYLNTVQLGDVGTIGSYGIASSGVTDLTIGNVTRIEDNAFVWNNGLTSATFGNVGSTGGFLFHDNYSTYYGSLSSLTMGDVTSIGDYAFASIETLRTVSLGAVDNIGNSAFNGCYSLNTLTIGTATVMTIGDYAFAGTALSSFTYTGNIDTVGSGAFANCNSLSTVSFGRVNSLGNSVVYDETRVFNGTNISSVSFSGVVAKVSRYAFSGSSIGEIAFNGSVGTIEPYAFFDMNMYSGNSNKVAFASTIVSIENYAFYNWLGNEISFGGSISTIGNYAFAYCYNLNELVLPEGLMEVPSSAFRSCSSLHEVTLPSTLRTLASDAFAECKYILLVYNKSSRDVASAFDKPLLVTSDSRKAALTYYSDGNSGASFVKADGSWYVYRLPYSQSYNICMLPDTLSVGEETVSHYKIRAYASSGYSENHVYIPTSVDEIASDVFDLTAVSYIYYKGTALTQWNRINKDISTKTVYCYKDCLHEGDGNYWRYDDSRYRPTTAYTDLESLYTVTTQPTCLTEGVESATCPNCNRVFTRNIGYGDHNVVGDECTVCHKKVVKLLSNNMTSIACGTVTNDASQPFTVDASGNITSTNKYHSSSSSFIFTASKSVTVTFTVTVSSESNYDWFRYYINDSIYDSMSGYNTRSYTVELSAGDVLKFSYSKDGSTSSGNDNIVISNLTFIYTEDAQNNA